MREGGKREGDGGQGEAKGGQGEAKGLRKLMVLTIPYIYLYVYILYLNIFSNNSK